MRPIKPGKEQDKLEQHFREQLRNMEVAPPAAMWDRLEDGLDRERKKIRYDHWYYALLVLLLPLTVTNVVVNHNIKGYYKEFLKEKKREQSFGPKYNLLDGFPSQLKHLDKIYERTISQPLHMVYMEDVPNDNVSSPAAVSGKQHISQYIAAIGQNGTSGYERNSSVAGDDGRRLFQHSRLGLDNGLALGGDEDYYAISGKIKLHLIDVTGLGSDKEYNLPVYNKRYYKRAARRNSPLTLPKITGFYAGIDGGADLENIGFRHTSYPIVGMNANIVLPWGYSYGVKAGYNFSRHFGIEAEWVISSAQESQYYFMYGGKIPVTGNINLRYTQIPVVAKYKFSKVSRVTGQPVSFNLLAGALYGHLEHLDMSGYSESPVPSTNANQFFAPNQLGLIAGMDYDVYINRYLFFTIGGRGSVVTDIKADWKGNSYGLMLGVNAGLNIQFPEFKKGNAEKTTITEP